MGMTNIARGGQPAEAYDKIIKAYLMGLFPFKGSHLNMYEFSELYKVPLQMINKRMRGGLVENSLLGGDLRKKLEEERLNRFDAVLNRLGTTDRDIDQLLRYLAAKILTSFSADPLMVKELNAAIGNKIRLSETELKAVVLINQALSTIPEEIENPEDPHLSREEILHRLNQINLDPKLLAGYLEGTPDLTPPGATKAEKTNLNKLASHEFQPRLPIASAAVIPDIIVPPQ